MATTNSKKLFHWTVEESALLLKIIFDYNVAQGCAEVSRPITEAAKSAAEQDWVTIRSKFDELSERFIEAYPDETTDEFRRGET